MAARMARRLSDEPTEGAPPYSEEDLRTYLIHRRFDIESSAGFERWRLQRIEELERELVRVGLPRTAASCYELEKPFLDPKHGHEAVRRRRVCKVSHPGRSAPAPRPHPRQRHAPRPGGRRTAQALLCPHPAPHSFCSALLAQGTPPTEVQRYSGHARLSTLLDVYSHFIPSEQTGSIERLAGKVLGQ